MSEPKADLLVTGEYLVTMNANREIISEGGVAISGNSIIATGPAAELLKKYPDEKEIRFRN